MRTICSAVAACAMYCGVHVFAQEKPVPRDSTRVTIPGCVRGSTLITATPERHESTRPVRDGQRYRLATRKGVLKDMEKQKGSMVEITGLVRTSQIEQGGVSVLGGRVRIGGAMPRSGTGSDVTRDPRYNEVVLDVESWQPLPDACPIK